jgi:hypothetical protein
MRLRPVAQLHRAERHSMRPNPLDVDPEQRCDLLGLEQSPSHRRVLASDVRNRGGEVGVCGIIRTAHGELPRGRRRARRTAQGVGMHGTTTAAVASTRAAAISDSGVPTRITRPIALSEVRIGRAARRSRHTAVMRGESSKSEGSLAHASRASWSPWHALARVSPASLLIVGSQTRASVRYSFSSALEVPRKGTKAPAADRADESDTHRLRQPGQRRARRHGRAAHDPSGGRSPRPDERFCDPAGSGSAAALATIRSRRLKLGGREGRDRFRPVCDLSIQSRQGRRSAL